MKKIIVKLNDDINDPEQIARIFEIISGEILINGRPVEKQLYSEAGNIGEVICSNWKDRANSKCEKCKENLWLGKCEKCGR